MTSEVPPPEPGRRTQRASDIEGHVHGHGSLRLETGSPLVARALAIGIGLLLLATVVGLVILRPQGPGPEAPGVTPGTVFVYGQVGSVAPAGCPTEYGPGVTCSLAMVEVANGPTKGDTAELYQTTGLPGSIAVEPGDDIRMSYFPLGTPGFEYTFDDFERGQPLLLLGALFVAAVVALSRLQGFRALLGMAISLAVVAFYLLPALLRGQPTLPLAIVVATVVAFAVLYLAHGIHVGTHVAFAGSVLSLLLAGVLGAIFIPLSRFTGLTDDTVATLAVTAGDLDVRGLLLAGLIIGVLGVLDDITVTQVSAVAELQKADPTASAFELYRAGLRIGRDHVASTVNTLILAYAGASLPLLLLISQGGRSFGGVLTSENIAVEVVRALVGSIGLVASVPITTGLAAWVVHRPEGAGAHGPSIGDEPEDGEGDPWKHPDDADFWARP